MKNDTRQKILAYIEEKKEVSTKDVINEMEATANIKKAIIFRHLKKLIETNKIEKRGTTPRVFYYPTLMQTLKNYKTNENIPDKQFQPSTIKHLTNLAGNYQINDFIEKNYIYISPTGQILFGIVGFEEWCKKNNFNIQQKAKEYIETKQKYNAYFENGLINGMDKLKTTFPTIYLDGIYYLDFYAIEKFGKTKLGSLLLYAKQAQNKELMSYIFTEVKGKIQKFIVDNNISAVGFIPPTVKREVQFQRELEKALNIQLPKIKIVKVFNGIPITQKSLSNLAAKIENAHNTIVVDEKNIYKNILLIDDAVGSGATLNETAKKIKAKGLCSKKIIGLAITGSFKGFDVISEV